MRGAALTVGVLLFACAPAPRPATSARPAATASVTVAPAPTAPPLEARSADLVVPCAAASAEAIAGNKAVEDLSARIEALHADGSPDALARELEQLLATPCFRLAREDAGGRLRFETALSLRTWWRDGGHSWLLGQAPVDVMTGARSVGVPPTPRRALTIETASADDPIRPLLCPAKAVDDRSCGRDAAGFLQRAARAPQLVRAAMDRGDFCAGRVRVDTSGATPYAAFYACLENGPGEDVLPLGAFKAPTDGWFVVLHAAFLRRAGCEEDVAAYDLATGSAYFYGCRWGPPPARLAIGRVPLGALREAAWMSMLQHTTERGVRTRAEWYRVPEGIVIGRRAGEQPPIMRVLTEISDAPVLHWAWVRRAGGALVGRASGRFESFDSSLASHAFELLEIADAAFDEGCAPSAFPRAFPWDEPGPGVVADVRSAELLSSGIDAARKAFASASPRPGACAPLP